MYGVSDCLRRFCYSIGLVNGAIISGAIGAFVSIGLNYLLVLGPDRYRLGFIGAPIATLVAYLTIFVVLLAYTIIQTPSRAWCGFSRSMFRDLGINYRLGFQGACSLCSEWWAYEFLGIGSTFLGPATQAATAIFTSVLSILFSIPFAISLAAGIRVGYLIGAGNAGSAQVAAVAAQRIVIVISFMGGVALFLSRHSLGRLYSGDPHATKMVSDYVGCAPSLNTIPPALTDTSAIIFRSSSL
jgi:MATE family multidrug resistance protein